jgi:ankyrin repeat protein
VYCQLDYLGKCLPGRIQRAMEELPATLDETYERTLRDIDETNWEFSRRLFQCVAVAARPLHVEELAEFLAFDFSAGPIPKFRDGWRLEDPLEAVVSTCSTLLALVKVENSKVIQFSHFSVREFMTSTRFADKHDTISHRYHISTTPAHTLVARTCLGILLHFPNGITRDSLTEFPLAEYAAEHWFEHARFEGVSQEAEEGMKQLFDASKPHFATWLWISDPIWRRNPRRRAERPLLPRGTPLHYAAFCGLHTIVKSLSVQHPEHLHSRAVYDKSTPLHLASGRGYLAIARVLVEHGVAVTARDGSGQTALHCASNSGGIDLVQFLVEHGADVTTRSYYASTPLHLASVNGHIDVAQFLVEHGADTKAQNKSMGTPLHWVSCNGDLNFSRFLVEHGADVMSRSNDGETPLHLASLYGYLDLARFLIEHGADATARNKYG